jgi:hypothetical protein
LCSADDDFPIQLWDKLLPQAEITLNLMRASPSDPTKSAYEVVFGLFDHNQMPLAPPECKVVIHKNQVNTDCGIHMGLKDGISGQLPNIIAATTATSTTCRWSAFLIWLKFF